ncbi:hypothetical protein SDC9_162932 [bioreactor metagenome]|uniref:Uncharacterized protein n=1 Tax=bioreactor metagenome TaxID=1076179 RepID=A0A645FMG0_9ZZZZ
MALKEAALDTGKKGNEQGRCEQPAERDPDYWITFPDHLRGDVRIGEEAQCGGAEALFQVGVVTEVQDVDQQCQQCGDAEIEQGGPT